MPIEHRRRAVEWFLLLHEIPLDHAHEHASIPAPVPAPPAPEEPLGPALYGTGLTRRGRSLAPLRLGRTRMTRPHHPHVLAYKPRRTSSGHEKWAGQPMNSCRDPFSELVPDNSPNYSACAKGCLGSGHRKPMSQDIGNLPSATMADDDSPIGDHRRCSRRPLPS
jgi:hypothetical protein